MAAHLNFCLFCSQLQNFTQICSRGDSSINVALKTESLPVCSWRAPFSKMYSSYCQSGGLTTSSQFLRLDHAGRHPWSESRTRAHKRKVLGRVHTICFPTSFPKVIINPLVSLCKGVSDRSKSRFCVNGDLIESEEQRVGLL
jgi:hypothetical protein